jgi:predicted metal-binding membrane protein
MGGMEMPGGWTMSHMWMLMPGQSWLGATASFVGMWTVMMVAMMVPSFTPTLLRYHGSLGDRVAPTRAGWLTAVVATAYFAIWAALGLLVFPVGVAIADAAMREEAVARVVPIMVAAIVVIVGLLQVSAWKKWSLSHCRDSSSVDASRPLDASAAWRHGLCLGVHCVRSCAGVTVIALCLGVMDLRVMAGVALWSYFKRVRA